MINQIITWAAVLFLILGGIDYLLGGRFGLGSEFEKGFTAAGRLLLCMTGFLVLAPVLAQLLSPAVSPLFRTLGLDPSLFSGLLLANDSGGAALAMELADDPEMGLFSGLIVGAMMGTTVMFVIPLTVAGTTPEHRPAAIYGLLAGVITVPIGCLVGGLTAGFDPGAVLRNTLPVLMIALFLTLMLIFFRTAIVGALSLLGKGILALSVAGLVISGVQRLTGLTLVAELGSLDEAFSIVGNICIFLAGIFPLLSVMQKFLSRPLKALGTKLNINSNSLSGLILALANGIPVFSLLNDMDDKGRMLNVAFLVSVSCVFGDHLAYTTQAAPELCTSMILGKLAGGISALLLALVLAPRLLHLQTQQTACSHIC